jgi:hypothetical protein
MTGCVMCVSRVAPVISLQGGTLLAVQYFVLLLSYCFYRDRPRQTSEWDHPASVGSPKQAETCNADYRKDAPADQAGLETVPLFRVSDWRTVTICVHLHDLTAPEDDRDQFADSKTYHGQILIARQLTSLLSSSSSRVE